VDNDESSPLEDLPVIDLSQARPEAGKKSSRSRVRSLLYISSSRFDLPEGANHERPAAVPTEPGLVSVLFAAMNAVLHRGYLPGNPPVRRHIGKALRRFNLL